MSNMAKLGDMGSANLHGSDPPLLADQLAGDPDYAPPEWLYPSAPVGDQQIQARDLYLLGSLILFLFVGTSTTSSLLTALPRRYHPRLSSQDFESVLPHLREAFDLVCEELEKAPGASDLLVRCFRELCDPDPRRRGNSAAGVYQNRYSVDRYVSFLDRLEKQARIDRQKRPTT